MFKTVQQKFVKSKKLKKFKLHNSLQTALISTFVTFCKILIISYCQNFVFKKFDELTEKISTGHQILTD